MGSHGVAGLRSTVLEVEAASVRRGPIPDPANSRQLQQLCWRTQLNPSAKLEPVGKDNTLYRQGGAIFKLFYPFSITTLVWWLQPWREGGVQCPVCWHALGAAPQPAWLTNHRRSEEYINTEASFGRISVHILPHNPNWLQGKSWHTPIILQAPKTH